VSASMSWAGPVNEMKPVRVLHPNTNYVSGSARVLSGEQTEAGREPTNGLKQPHISKPVQTL